MRFIFKALAMALVLFVGWKLFPQIISFQDVPSLIVTSVLLYAIALVVGIIIGIALGVVASLLKIDLFRTSVLGLLAITVVISIAVFYISISIISAKYGGFTFSGNWWQLLITSVILGFITSESNNSKNN